MYSNVTMEDPLLTAKEVASRMRVNPRTVAKWARAGKLPVVRTFGGHYRFRKSEIDKILGVVKPEHVAEVKFMAAWQEWRPECVCGWTGSYHRRQDLAEKAAAWHVEDHANA